MVEGSRERVYQASPDLDSAVVPALARIPYFRLATADEVEQTFAAYQGGDAEQLCETWARVAEPTRAAMPTAMRVAYAQAGRGPWLVNATIFLDSVRAALRAGERFRERLPARARRILETEFTYLERRHEHIPPGSPAAFEFPDAFDRFVCHGDDDDTRARWQLAVALNEVQQCCYTDFAAEHLRLPVLHRHAERERDLVRNYFGHWSPRCTLDLWRETIYVLDALNAATFELVCTVLLPRIMGLRAPFSRAERKRRWQAFVAGLDEPQSLVEPEGRRLSSPPHRVGR